VTALEQPEDVAPRVADGVAPHDQRQALHQRRDHGVRHRVKGETRPGDRAEGQTELHVASSDAARAKEQKR
jgi:hypothetical protein